MYFDFEDRLFEEPSLDSAMSWREQVLMSLFVHLVIGAVLLFAPQLPFVRELAEARAERLAELAAQQQQQELPPLAEAVRDDRTFVFIEPRVDLESQVTPRPDAPLSDRDRLAQSPTQAEDPLNNLPNAEGNSLSFVESDDFDEGEIDPETEFVALDDDEDTLDPIDPATEDASELAEVLADGDVADPSQSPEEPGDLSPEDIIAQALADGALTLPGDGREDPDAFDPAADRPADGLLGRAMQNLERYVQRESFANRSWATGQYGPWIQFDSKGADFGPCLRRFVAEIRQAWFVPYAIMSRSLHGNVVLTFYVHRDGSITDLTIAKPAEVDAFTNSAFNALATVNPTQPLPPEYPDDSAFFTVTFFFNETPPA